MKMYYLQTRWYDPEIGRFINLDQIAYLDPETVNGLNLYAYCGNNPVMGYDPTGTFWFTFLTTVIGAVVGAVVGAVDYLINNKDDIEAEEFVEAVIAGGASGGTAGLILGLTKGKGIAAASYAAAFVGSLVSETADYVTKDKALTGENILDSVLDVAWDTTVDGTLNYFANSIGSALFTTNSGWIVPKKFVSYFTKSYGQKMMFQTFFAGGFSALSIPLISPLKKLSDLLK